MSKSQDLCIICLQHKKDKVRPLALKEFQENTCDCNAFIHRVCIEEWYKRKESCPICHEPLVTNFDDPSGYAIDDESIEQMVAYQLVNNRIVGASLYSFLEMRQESRRLLYMYLLWGLFVLGILFVKGIPRESFIRAIDNEDRWMWSYYY